jgi:peptidoglycan/xylan/chitin deacetylase (PgdA/CDA1 family)
MLRIPFCVLALFWSLTILPATLSAADFEQLQAELLADFADKVPQQWGENVTGVHLRLTGSGKILALTLDACGSANGRGVDLGLLDFLVKEKIPATLFINGRWIDANFELFQRLAKNPLFEIGNHGLWHKPASINGRSVYGINGTADVAELSAEIELNARKIEAITGWRPRYYRSGTAYYDEYAVQVSRRLGHEVIGFSVLGDKGATFSAEQVEKALLGSQAGDIIIAHMNHPEAGTGAGIIAAVPQLQARGFTFVHLSKFLLLD